MGPIFHRFSGGELSPQDANVLTQMLAGQLNSLRFAAAPPLFVQQGPEGVCYGINQSTSSSTGQPTVQGEVFCNSLSGTDGNGYQIYDANLITINAGSQPLTPALGTKVWLTEANKQSLLTSFYYGICYKAQNQYTLSGSTRDLWVVAVLPENRVVAQAGTNVVVGANAGAVVIPLTTVVEDTTQEKWQAQGNGSIVKTNPVGASVIRREVKFNCDLVLTSQVSPPKNPLPGYIVLMITDSLGGPVCGQTLPVTSDMISHTQPFNVAMPMSCTGISVESTLFTPTIGYFVTMQWITGAGSTGLLVNLSERLPALTMHKQPGT